MRSLARCGGSLSVFSCWNLVFVSTLLVFFAVMMLRMSFLYLLACVRLSVFRVGWFVMKGGREEGREEGGGKREEGRYFRGRASLVVIQRRKIGEN